MVAISIYTMFGASQATKPLNRGILCGITALLWIMAWTFYHVMPDPINILPQQFQQFNPFFVVALTPVSMAVFGALAKKGKEPSSPRKIGLGMIVAALRAC